MRGNPGRMAFMKVFEGGYSFYPLIIALRGVKLAREAGVEIEPVRAREFCVAAPSSSSLESKELGLALAEALEFPYLEIERLEELEVEYRRALLVEDCERGRTRFLAKFVDTSSGELEGPVLRVGRVVYRSPM